MNNDDNFGRPAKVLNKSHSSINSIDFSSDYRYCALGTNICKLLSIFNNFDEIRNFGEPGPRISSVKISSNSYYIATGGFDHTARIYLLDTAKLLNIYKHHKDVVSSVCFDSTVKIFSTGSYDNTVNIYELNLEEKIYQKRKVKSLKDLEVSLDDLKYKFKDHDQLVNCVRFSSNDLLFATASADNKVILYC